jgi:integrase
MQGHDAPRKLARHVRAHPNLDARIRKSERADGTWVFEIRKPDRSYETVGTRLDQAKARLAEVTTAESRGEQLTDPNMTVKQLIAQFRDTHKVSADKARAFNRIEERWGLDKLRHVQHADISAWWPTLKRQDGKEGPLDEDTKRQIVAHFSSLMEYAVEIGKLGQNPVKAMPTKRRPKQGESRRRILTRDEETRLLAYTAPFPWLADIILVSLNQALRLGEVLGLQWEDVLFDQNKIRVQHTLDRNGALGGTKHQKLTGKRDPRDVKPIDLMPATREILLRLRMDSDGTGLVFRNTFGRKRQRRAVQLAFHKAVTRAALPVTEDGAVNFHSLRHTCLSRLANNPEIPLVYVRDFAGHSDLSITNSYVHGIESASVTEAAARALAGGQS